MVPWQSDVGDTRTTSPVAVFLARLLSEWARDAVLVIVVIIALIAARGGLMMSLWAYAGPRADGWGVVVALIRGFPFDCRTGVILCLPTLVFSLPVGWRADAYSRARPLLRYLMGTVVLSGIFLLTVIDHFYFREYANQFDHFVIGLVYDDTTAILTTVWRQQPVLWASAGLLAFIGICAWSMKRVMRWSPVPLTWLGRRSLTTLSVAVLISLTLIICGARGSVSRLPAQSKNVAVTADEKLLNRLVLNPLASLQSAISDFQDNQSGDVYQFLKDGDIRAAAERLSGSTIHQADLDQYFARTALGPQATPPRHIVILVMESYSAWPMLDRYAAMGLSDQLRRIAAAGVSCPRFISEGIGTIFSVGPLLSGMPDCGLMQSYQPQTRRAFATALAPAFRRLGYRTRFFYSGYLSWQRLGTFVEGQGFEEINGGGVISDWTNGNEWGVDDAQLLDYVARQQIDASPTLDVVLTTSNHPPYSVDVYGQGFPLRAVPAALQTQADDTINLNELGHLWFSDQALGRFVDRVAQAQPDTLFVITGDHYGRRFINRAPDPFERSAVPCVFSGPAIAGRQLAATAGSHLDLIPTLIELCAPAGFAYHALGHDLFATPQATAITRVGAFSTSATGSATSAIAWGDQGDAQQVTPEQRAAWQRVLTDRTAIAWWRIVKGTKFTEDPTGPAP